MLAQIRDEHPIVEKIESWRELTKLKNTYLDSLPDLIDPETGRVHTTFNQAATTTGRLSSTNPNLQNIPIRTEIGRPVRACFVAEQGAQLLSADYSQVELRVLAHVADEEVLKEVFRAGEDVHAATAAEVFEIGRDEVDVGQRSKAKMVNFGIVYGLTGFGLADRLNIPRKEGEEFVARYLERFPAVRAFREQVVERAQEEGYVTTLMGRRRQIPELRSGNPNTRRLGERLAVNTVIQGTAADIIKVAMVRCQRALRGGRGGDPPGPADPRRAPLRGPAGGDGGGDRAGASARCAPPTSSIRRSRSTSASAPTGSPPSDRPQLEWSPSSTSSNLTLSAPNFSSTSSTAAPGTRSATVQLAPLPLSSWPLGPELDGPGPELSSPRPPWSSPGSSPWPPRSSPGSASRPRTPWPPRRSPRSSSQRIFVRRVTVPLSVWSSGSEMTSVLVAGSNDLIVAVLSLPSSLPFLALARPGRTKIASAPSATVSMVASRARLPLKRFMAVPPCRCGIRVLPQPEPRVKITNRRRRRSSCRCPSPSCRCWNRRRWWWVRRGVED